MYRPLIIIELSKLKKQMGAFFFAFLTISSSGCAYRFTNQHIRLPTGIKTVAIEAIYDTSREVIPHELLWGALQHAFAADGHLLVVSQGKADALVRAHLTQAGDSPTGSGQDFSKKNDESKGSDLPKPGDFRVLPEAGEFTTKQRIVMTVAVEIVDLYSKNVIFTNTYNSAREFSSFRSETTVAQKKSHFLLFEEARTAKVKEMSNDIAQEVVRDFLVGR